MQQGVLLAGVRGCDGIHKEGPFKVLNRGLRATFIKSAKTKGSFNARRPTKEKIWKSVEEFCESYIDEVPMHFVTHLMHAAEVVAYSHPSGYVGHVWLGVYVEIVRRLHLNLETEQEFQARLKDDEEQVKREDEFDLQCYESGDYGDGTGTVNESDK